VRGLREATHGPFKLYTALDYVLGPQTPGYPDLKKEMNFYKEDPKRPGIELG
jgi:hypothetical protein